MVGLLAGLYPNVVRLSTYKIAVVLNMGCMSFGDAPLPSHLQAFTLISEQSLLCGSNGDGRMLRLDDLLILSNLVIL